MNSSTSTTTPKKTTSTVSATPSTLCVKIGVGILVVGFLFFAMLALLHIINMLNLQHFEFQSLQKHQYHPFEPSLPGVMPGQYRPHIVLAQDIGTVFFFFVNLLVWSLAHTNACAVSPSLRFPLQTTLPMPTSATQQKSLMWTVSAMTSLHVFMKSVLST